MPTKWRFKNYYEDFNMGNLDISFLVGLLLFIVIISIKLVGFIDVLGLFLVLVLFLFFSSHILLKIYKLFLNLSFF